MSFYVEKLLATGKFRFAARRRRELTSIDDDLSLSTGPSGEFVRHRPEVFYSADHRPIRNPELPKPRSIATTPFWSSLFDGTPRGWGYLAAMLFGTLLVLLGFVVVGKGRPAGWVEVILGLALLLTPLVLTIQKRRVIHAVEERRRAEHAERDERDREMLSAYSAALDSVRAEPSDANLNTLRREREKLDLAYAIWGDAARATVLQVGFNELARSGADHAAEIAALMDRASNAAGLVAEDTTGVKYALYSTVLWHFLADDRLGEHQLRIVRSLQSGMGIQPADVPTDTSSEEQFERLRGVDHRNVPRCESAVPLGHREFCLHNATAESSSGTINAVVTNKRLVLESGKREEILIADIDDIDVDAETSTLSVTASGRKRALELKLEEPVYFASLLSLATTLDEKPKSFT